jgi:hypothetical protein
MPNCPIKSTVCTYQTGLIFFSCFIQIWKFGFNGTESLAARRCPLERGHLLSKVSVALEERALSLGIFEAWEASNVHLCKRQIIELVLRST